MSSIPIDPMLLADLAATCNNLGYYDEAQNKYMREPECLECVKELIRFLRRDDENHEIRRALGETKVLVKDLLPIVKYHAEDKELFEVTVRLLVNLTTPVQVLYEEELPGEREARRFYMELVQYLQAYKEAFADKLFWSSLVGQLTNALGKEWEDRMEDDRLNIERILILLRNVLHVPADPAREKRTDDDASVHDQVLWAIHSASLEDLLLFIAQSQDETHLCMHVLEVVSLMLRGQEGRQLARSGTARCREEREKDTLELQAARNRENAAKQSVARKFVGGRHTRFGGTYRVENLTSISERDIIYHKPLAQINQISFDKNKTNRRTPRNRLPLKEEGGTRRSVLSIRLFLKQFCVEFLAAVYNKLMYDVRDHLARAKGQLHDESFYMWAIKFFMEFNRNHQFRIAYVSETLSVSVFHYLQTQMELYMESMTVEKNKIKVWSKRLYLALRAYQELLFTLQHMVASGNQALKQSAHVLQSNLFYMPEYRELVYVLISKYDPIKMSRQFLKELVLTIHVFLKLLETFSGGGRVLVKQKRSIRRKTSNKKSGKSRETAPQFHQAEQVDTTQVWQDISQELSGLVASKESVLHVSAVPFDAASSVPIDEQRSEAVFRIQEHLHSSRCPEALALLRAAREVWPEGDVFGSAEISAEDELMALREIHLCKLPARRNIPVPAAELPESENNGSVHNGAGGGEAEEGMEEESEENEEVIDASDGREQEFDFPAFVNKFCSPKVLEPYCRLLRSFDTNSAETNHCLLKMLYRIAGANKLPAMLFQASLFRTFHKLMDNESFYRDPRFKDLVVLAKLILRKFFAAAATNKLVFVEMLFWKSQREAYEVEHGYDSYREQRSSNAAKISWSEEEEDELGRLYEEFKSAEVSEDKDVVDRILDNLICRERSRRAVIKKLKQLGLVTNTRALKKRGAVGSRVSVVWSEQEEQQLHQLWQECRSAVDPLTMIRDRLTVKRSKKKIGDKLLELGLASERRELYKKRTKSTKKSLASHAESDDEVRRGSGSDSDSDSSSSSESDSVPVSRARPNPSDRSVSDAPRARAAVINYLQNTDAAVSREFLLWLKESLEEAVILRKCDPDEHTAMVPLTETCCSSIETPAVRNLLETLGALPPSDQEMFWRWPSTLPVPVLERNISVLTQCLDEKTQTKADDGAAVPVYSSQQSDQHGSQHSDVSASVVVPLDDDSDGSSPTLHHSLSSASLQQSKTKRSAPDDLSDSVLSPTVSRKRSRRATVLSDTDSSGDEATVIQDGDEATTIHEEDPAPAVTPARVNVLNDTDSSGDEATVRQGGESTPTVAQKRTNRLAISSDSE